MLPALRFADGDDATIEGWAVPFDGSFDDGRDSYGTKFSARTDFRLNWYSERPLLWHHGLDKDVGLTPVGVVRSMEVRDQGVWMKAQLDAQSEYFAAIREMVKAGKVFLSSGSVEHLVKIDARSGHVDVWPIVEQTLTTTPSNLLASIPVVNLRSALPKQHHENLLDEDVIVTDAAIRAVWSQKLIDTFPDSSFAYVEDGADTDKSKRHLPYKDKDGKPDAAHVKNALARLDQTDIPASAKASAKKKLVAAAHTLGIETNDDDADDSGDAARSARGATRFVGDDDAGDVGSDERSFEDICADLDRLLNPMYAAAYTQRLNTFATHVIVKRCEYLDGYSGYSFDDDDESVTYWDIPYTLGADLEPVLGTPVQVARNETFTPVARSFDAPLSFEAQQIVRHTAAFVRSTEGYGERRFRAGRELSAKNLQLISDTADGLEAHAKNLRDLHARAVVKQDEAARAAYWLDPDAQQRELDLALLELVAAGLMAPT